jgi:membrane associated rhomboid family serine protease
MGIHDREYYRSENRGANLFSTAPVCKAIIFINVGVFLLEHLNIVDGNLLHDWFAATSAGIFRQGYVWQLLTATFLHGSLLHLLVNTYFLWVFGREMEEMYGERDFLALYLSAAVLSTLGWAAIDALAPKQGLSITHSMIGASGAIFAVVVLYAMFYPRRELLFMFVIPVEVWLLVSLYVAYDAYTLLSGVSTGTAVASHITGALYGFLYKKFDIRWSRLPWNRVKRPRLRIVPADPPREKPASRPATSSSPGPTWATNSASASKPAATAVVPEEQLEARLDEVLAKIAREGRSGLTEDENRILQEASRRARNKRSDRL